MALRSEELGNASWANVGTPVVTSNEWVSPVGFTHGELIDDDDAGALEGKSQSRATTSQLKHTLSCYMRSGTATTATLKMVGTGNSAGDQTCTFTGLNSTTARKSCTSSAAYGAGITSVLISVLAGDSAAVTGSIRVWGCQFEARDGATPYVRTTTANVTRATPLGASWTNITLGTRPMFEATYTPGITSDTAHYVVSAYNSLTDSWQMYWTPSTGRTTCSYIDAVSEKFVTHSAVTAVGTPIDMACRYSGGQLYLSVNGVTEAAANTITPTSTVYAVSVGKFGGGTGSEAAGLISDVSIYP
jgi:hypothetical protein